MRSMSPAKSQTASHVSDESDTPHLEARLQAMEAARPDDAPPLASLANSEWDAGDVEMLQLDAFEAGEQHWWLVRPRAEEAGFGAG